MTPRQKRLAARIIRDRYRRDSSPYRPDDDMHIVDVRVRLGGAFTSPQASALHRAEAMRERSRKP